MDKNEYCIHYRNLNCVVDLGVKITKVHNIVIFKQSLWLKGYIDFNSERRKEATTDFENDFIKLMNSSCCGRKMEMQKVACNYT